MSESGDGIEGAEATVRAYYEAIDAGDYDRFADLLAPEVVHQRPDRTIEGRETLVGFVREGRPKTDTTHVVEAVYRNSDAGTEDDGDENCAEGGGEEDYAVRGRLLDAEENPMFSFVDAFEVEDGRIERIRTYTR